MTPSAPLPSRRLAPLLPFILRRTGDFSRQGQSCRTARSRRREMIHSKGKIDDGEVLDVDGVVILDANPVGAVKYTVGQDVAALQALLPKDRMLMVGPASVKLDPKNPPNSIVLYKQCGGIRRRAFSERP